MLHIIVLLIQLLLGLGEKSLGSLVLLDFDLALRQFLGSSLIHVLHFGLSGLSCSLLLNFLLLMHLLLSLFLLGTLNLRSLLHPRDIRGRDDCSLTNGTFAVLIDVCTHFAEVFVSDDCNVLV